MILRERSSRLVGNDVAWLLSSPTSQEGRVWDKRGNERRFSKKEAVSDIYYVFVVVDRLPTRL